MLALIQFYIQLCLLRAKPQDLPASQALLGLVAALNVILGGSIAAMAFGGPLQGLAAGLLDTALMGGYVWVLLGTRNYRERFVQTASAVLGVSALASAIGLPLQVLLPVEGEVVTAAGQFASLSLLALIIWLQVALGHIFRHALGISLMLGVGLAFVYAFVSGMFLQSLFLASR